MSVKLSKIHAILIMLLAYQNLSAQQETQFSQFYAAPLFMNPAMAGGSMMPRVMFNYRNQWPGSLATFSSTQISGDYYLDRFNSGFGLVLLNDSQGPGKVVNNSANIQYAYQLQFNEDNMLRLGAEGQYTNAQFNTKGLTFGDQFSNGGGVGSPGRGFTLPTNDPLASLTKPVHIFDVGTGLLFNNRKFWLGTSVKNLRGKRPSFAGPTAAQIDNLRRYSAHGGVNFIVKSPSVLRFRRAEYEDQDATFTIASQYRQQGGARQMDTGAYLYIPPITLGAWYRGVPIFPNTNDAVIGLIGYKQDRFSVGYSYDVTVSTLGLSSGGAHELSLRYEFLPADRYDKMRLKRRKQELSCPKF